MLILPAGVAWSQNTTAVVTGAERVFVRRGPGTEFPPFASVPSGTTVDVQEMRGEWARIVTASGQVGYINSTFLALPGERERPTPRRAPTAPAAEAPPPAAQAHTTHTPVASTPVPPASSMQASPTPAAASGNPSESAALRAASDRNKALEAELRSLQKELAELKSRPQSTPVPAPTAPTATPASTAAAAAGTEQLHSDLARLSTAVDQLQRRLDAGARIDEAVPVPGVTDGASHVASPAAVLLGMLGIVVGWLLGSGYARRQERGRRSRIRF